MKSLLELWHYRELIRNLVVRDLKVRYRSSVLGVAWSWLNPLLMMVVYTIVFSIIFKQPDIHHYPVFLISGLLPWNFFNDSVLQATNSIVGSAHLIKKVYFPREVLPISIAISNLINFLISLPIFFLLVVLSGADLTWWALLLPIPIILELAFTVGIGLIFATLNVFYRDTRHILQVVMLAWFFLTPIFYPINSVPQEKYLLGQPIAVQLWLRRLNPMASIIASYRDLLYRGVPTGWDFLLRTTATVFLVLIIGYAVFYRYSPSFGEEI